MELFERLANITKPETTTKMLPVKASIVVMSYLSDSELLMSMGQVVEAKAKIRFAKYIILKTKGDLTQEIDAEEMYEDCINNKK